MITTLIKALGFSLGCSGPMNCQANQSQASDNSDTIITTIIVDDIQQEIPNELSSMQDLSKIYTI